MADAMGVAASPVFKGNAVIIERGLIGIKTSAIRPCDAYERRREIQDLSKLPFALPDLLFRPIALGDVDHSTHELNQIAGRAEKRVAYYMDISAVVAVMHDSLTQLQLGLLTPPS